MIAIVVPKPNVTLHSLFELCCYLSQVSDLTQISHFNDLSRILHFNRLLFVEITIFQLSFCNLEQFVRIMLLFIKFIEHFSNYTFPWVCLLSHILQFDRFFLIGNLIAIIVLYRM